MELTKDQVQQFEAFGFLHLKQLFTGPETAGIAAAANEVWADELGRPPRDTDCMSLPRIVEPHPGLTELLVLDDRLYRPLRQLLGDDMIWSGSEGNRGFEEGKTSHHWHADRPGRRELGYLRIKVMIYLDPMRREQGAFRVIPGSHLPGFHELLQPMQEAHVEGSPVFFGIDGADILCHAVETDPGDAVLFSQNLFHAVYGKTGARRYIALKYASRPRGDADLASLNEWSPYAFEPHEAYAGSGDPRLREMVRGLAELGSRAAALPYP